MGNNINDAFATPKSKVAGAGNGSTVITNEVVNQLKRTRPWVLLLSILGFISTAFMALGTIGMFLGGGAAMFQGTGNQALATGGAVMAAGIAYLLMTLLYFFASLFLYRYAKSIKNVVNQGTTEQLELALKAQASFWKLVGILTLIMLVLIVIGIVFGVGAAIMGAAGS